MRKLSEIGKSFTKRRNESVDFQSPTDAERFSQSSVSEEHKSRDSIDIIRPPPPPPPQTPDRKGRSLERGPPRPSSPEPPPRLSLSSEPPGRLSLTNDAPCSPSFRHSSRLSNDLTSSFSHEPEDFEGKSKFRANLKRLSLKNLSRNKSDHKGADKRVMQWVMSFSQFSAFAPKFAFTTWDQLLTYTLEDLTKLGLPAQASLPMSKIIAVLAEESAMENKEHEATNLPYSLLQVPEGRPRSFSYNNRAIATSEHVKTLEELFMDLDTENRGFINESELSVALQRYGVIEQEGAKAWFADIDNNQRGVIDQQQFVDFMTYVYPLIFQTPSPVWSPSSRTQHVEPPTIFLGGSCNPTSWRKDIVIPLLTKASISYFNPQVEEWNEALIAIEARAKASATLLFFVIDSLTLSLATMIECTELITSGRPVVLVINDLPPDAKLANGEAMPKQVMRDANRARAYMADVAVRHRIQPYSSISRAACELIQFLHGGWTGGGYETRPRATLAKKSEESWTALKQKVQAALMKMNASRRGSLRSLPEPSALTLPPPRTPERAMSNPVDKRVYPIDTSASAPPDLPYFSGSFPPTPGSPTGANGPLSPHAHATLSSPPSSPTKPVNVLGNFPQLGGSPPLRPSNRGSLANMSIPLPPLLMTGRAGSDPRSMFESIGEFKHARTKTRSISSLADIAEGVKLDDLTESRAKTDSVSSDKIEPVVRSTSAAAGPKNDSPRSSIASNPDHLAESPVTTPLGSTPCSFLSLSPANSSRSSFN